MKTTLERPTETQIPRTFSPLSRLRTTPTDKGAWAAACATVGAAVWAGLAVLARVGMVRLGAIELLFLFAPLVIVPLGLELGRAMSHTGGFQRLARRLQPVGESRRAGGSRWWSCALAGRS